MVGAGESSGGGSVTLDLAALRNSDPNAEQAIYSRYREALAAHSRKWVTEAMRRVVDEEDLAQETLWGCLKAIRENRSKWVTTRSQLWRCLVTAARNRAFDLQKRLGRKKRGGDMVRGESAFIGGEGSDAMGGIERAPDPAVPVERICMETESVHRLLSSLREEVRQVALLKQQGYSNHEIASRLGVAVVTVSRRLTIIRTKWKEIAE